MQTSYTILSTRQLHHHVDYPVAVTQHADRQREVDKGRVCQPTRLGIWR